MFGEAEEGGAVVPVNKEEGKVVEVAVQEVVQKTEAVEVEALGVEDVQLEVTAPLLQAAVAQLQAAVTRLEGTVARMDGRIGKLEGVDYERHVSRTFMGVLSSALGRMRRGRLLHSVAYGTTTEFSDLMEDLLDADKISEDQWHEILLSDAVVRGVKGGATVYAVAEISLTVHQDDIDRAAERAAIMRQATGATAYPVVVGASVPPPQMAQASEKGVTAIIVRQPGG